jgi:hypothetical protein
MGCHLQAVVNSLQKLSGAFLGECRNSFQLQARSELEFVRIESGETIGKRYTAALVRGSANVRNSVFDGPLIWLLPPRLGNEWILGVRRRVFG